MEQELAGVQNSAREWHKLQLAALGFVGLCGVLKGDSGGDLPMWLQTTTGVLVLVALAVAGVAVLVVASVAWPLTAGTEIPSRAASRLRAGVYLTVAAVAVTALATTGSWWPEEDEPEPTQLIVRSG